MSVIIDGNINILNFPAFPVYFPASYRWSHAALDFPEAAVCIARGRETASRYRRLNFL